MGNTISYSSFSRNVIYAGSYSLNVTSTLNNDPYSPPATTTQQSFTLTVVDPCLATAISIVPASVENLVTFAGFPV
jgi:uncharacterized membrane protein